MVGVEVFDGRFPLFISAINDTDYFAVDQRWTSFFVLVPGVHAFLQPCYS